MGDVDVEKEVDENEADAGRVDVDNVVAASDGDDVALVPGFTGFADNVCGVSVSASVAHVFANVPDDLFDATDAAAAAIEANISVMLLLLLMVLLLLLLLMPLLCWPVLVGWPRISRVISNPVCNSIGKCEAFPVNPHQLKHCHQQSVEKVALWRVQLISLLLLLL